MSKKQKATDPARFEGNGISYRAKIIGIEDVSEARGDKMCQETLQKLKGAMKASGQHKQRVSINVTLEGLKIIDGTAMTVLHTHPVHQISFISRDNTDSRAFGYIFGPGDGSHKFFGIKTANAAENVVLALRDLFQTVYEMKKQEIDDAKAKAEGGTEDQTEGQTESQKGQTEGQAEDSDKTEESAAVTDSQNGEDEENVSKVPKHTSPESPQKPEEAVDNLLVLESEVDNILKGIEQIKTLDFDEMTAEDSLQQPPAPSATCTATTTTTAVDDVWGLSSPASSTTTTTSTPATTSAAEDLFGLSTGAVSSPAPASSALSDLAQLSSGPPANNLFNMPPFPGAPAPGMAIPPPGFGMVQPGMGQPGMGQPGMGQPGMGQPFGHAGQLGPGMGVGVVQDPFKSDPFNTSHLQGLPLHQMGAQLGAPMGPQTGFTPPFPAATGPPSAGQSFPMGMSATGRAGVQPAFGRASPAFTPFGGSAPPTAGVGMQVAPPGPQGGDPFQMATENVLQPAKPGGGDKQPRRDVSPGQAALFEDLLDMKKLAGAESATKTPKEIFQELTHIPKKSLNELKSDPQPTAAAAAPQASVFEQDPFTEDPFGSLDTMLNTIASSDADPFTASLPPPSSSPPPLSPPSLPPQPPAPPDPTSARPHPTSTRPHPTSAPPNPTSARPHSTSARPDHNPDHNPDPSLSATSSKESTPEARFDVPSEPPPPLPSHLLQGHAAPSPPPRPPPIPSRPKPQQALSSPVTCTSVAGPPPLPTSPRPSAVASPSPGEPAVPDHSTADRARRWPQNGGDTPVRSSPRGTPRGEPPSPRPREPPSPRPREAPSPSQSWGSGSSLSLSSSQRSLEVASLTNSDDPFGVPLRSKKSFSSADGSSKRSSRSSGKSSRKSDSSRAAVIVDPFSVQLADRTTSSSDETHATANLTSTDSRFSDPFSDSVSFTHSQGAWEAFGDHTAYGVAGAQQTVAVTATGDKENNTSPF